MKKIMIVFILLTCHECLQAQNVGIGTTTPDASAQLDITSTTRGMLVPRMSSVQRTAIINPAPGLLVFDNTTNSFWFYNGTAWADLSGGGNTWWSLTGNSAAVDGTSFIGTTTNVPLSFRQNNIGIGRLDAAKNNIFFGGLEGGGTNETTATGNTFIGKFAALKANQGGHYNTATGFEALLANLAGDNNTANGRRALNSNTVGNNNTAFGNAAMDNNTTGNNNTAMGTGALGNVTTGSNNTGIGPDANVPSSSGSNQVRVGNAAITYAGIQVPWSITSDRKQ